jgi:hypothetical protein
VSSCLKPLFQYLLFISQELQQLIDESNQSLDEGGCPSLLIPGTSEVSVVVLHRDLPGNSVGITLAGGSDYESKEITVCMWLGVNESSPIEPFFNGFSGTVHLRIESRYLLKKEVE